MNFFTNRKDPVADLVKGIIQESDIERTAIDATNKRFGIYSRDRLSVGMQAEYDVALNETLTKLKAGETIVEDAKTKEDPKTVKKNTDYENKVQLRQKVKEIKEASKEKIGNYKLDAVDDAHDAGRDAHKAGLNAKHAKTDNEKSDWKDEKSYLEKIKAKREKGVSLAVNKLTGKAKVNAKESVEAEIRNHLLEQIKGLDEARAQTFVSALTEEQREILGEDWRAAAFGDNTSGGTLSNAGYKAPERKSTTTAVRKPSTTSTAKPVAKPVAKTTATTAKPATTAAPAVPPAKPTIMPTSTASPNAAVAKINPPLNNPPSAVAQSKAGMGVSGFGTASAIGLTSKAQTPAPAEAKPAASPYSLTAPVQSKPAASYGLPAPPKAPTPPPSATTLPPPPAFPKAPSSEKNGSNSSKAGGIEEEVKKPVIDLSGKGLFEAMQRIVGTTPVTEVPKEFQPKAISEEKEAPKSKKSFDSFVRDSFK